MIPLRPTDAPIEHTLADGRRVRVSGYCCGCGDCCDSGNPYTGEPGPCPHLDRRDGDHAICTGRDSAYYLSGCVSWPHKPEHIDRYPRCTYRVEVVG